MTDTELIDEVRKMRHWQAEYFKGKDHTALRYAKDFERRVDAELARRTRAAAAQQAKLF